MTWPDSIIEQFALVDLPTADASDFYGPYNTLLSTLFPAHEHYQVSPQCKRTPGAPGIRPGSRLYDDSDSMTMDSTGTEFTFMYVVSKWRVPVFFMQICAHAARMEADERMRGGGGVVEFAEFADGRSVEGRRAGSAGAKPLKLVGVCAMGTRFAVYELTAGDKQLLPARILPDPRFLVDTAPKERWRYDILDTAGEDKLREVVREVKAMTVDIDP